MRIRQCLSGHRSHRDSGFATSYVGQELRVLPVANSLSYRFPLGHTAVITNRESVFQCFAGKNETRLVHRTDVDSPSLRAFHAEYKNPPKGADARKCFFADSSRVYDYMLRPIDHISRQAFQPVENAKGLLYRNSQSVMGWWSEEKEWRFHEIADSTPDSFRVLVMREYRNDREYDDRLKRYVSGLFTDGTRLWCLRFWTSGVGMPHDLGCVEYRTAPFQFLGTLRRTMTAFIVDWFRMMRILPYFGYRMTRSVRATSVSSICRPSRSKISAWKTEMVTMRPMAILFFGKAEWSLARTGLGKLFPCQIDL